MLRIALTGGIASGKSYVLARFDAHGVPTIDADQLARDVVEPGQPAWEALRRRFGAEMFGGDGRLQRQRLATLVFADAGARADLEAIVHPPVQQAIDDWFRQQPATGAGRFAIACIPLLFETGRAGAFDRVIVTVCEPATQLERLAERDGLSPAEGRRRLAAQLPAAVRLAGADHVIRTDGSLASTDMQVQAIYRALAAEAAPAG